MMVAMSECRTYSDFEKWVEILYLEKNSWGRGGRGEHIIVCLWPKATARGMMREGGVAKTASFSIEAL